MRIRSITYFIDPARVPIEPILAAIRAHKSELKMNLESARYEVQSVRLATAPFPQWLELKDESKTIQQIRDLCDRSQAAGFDYLSLGPCRADSCHVESMIPAILSLSKILFLSMQLTDPQGRLSLPDIRSCADVIKRVADLEPDGFANLRFAALANVKPYTPFFPAAYGETGTLAFSLAMECADTALKIFEQAVDINRGCRSLCSTFEEHARALEVLIEKSKSKSPISFKGFDFSLAPFPEDWCSFGKALEAMGVSAIGSAGSLAAAASLAGALDSGNWKKAGFNGLMMPILEDSILAARSSAGLLSIYNVLQYSSVCGTGLDTVPLPGNIEVEKIQALLLDVAALALRLNKPLTARLMPIPGKKAGDTVEFDFSYFAKGKVLDFPYSGIGHPLTAGGKIEIKPRC
ncbi:MAG: DUF711 family protein [Anaerolineaceae bacterium]|jgi:hypothetical protein|nr:MAG: DUF711 family protein [Anaerolineaceae bacterium]